MPQVGNLQPVASDGSRSKLQGTKITKWKYLQVCVNKVYIKHMYLYLDLGLVTRMSHTFENIFKIWDKNPNPKTLKSKSAENFR